LKLVFNPLTANFDYVLSSTELDALYLRLDTANDPLTNDLEGKDYIKTRDLTVTHTSGKVASIAKTGGRTLTLVRNAYGYISTIADGTKTWTFSYNADNTTVDSIAIT